jgi:FlaA1/EpsC-like NDP-sugar epimerase
MAETRGPIPRFIFKYRRAGIVALHAGLIVLSNYVTLVLLFGRQQSHPPDYMKMLAWVAVIRLLTFIPFRLYEGLWRYTSVRDLVNIVAAVSLGTSISYAVLRWGVAEAVYPYSFYLLDSLLLIFLLGGVRLTRRVHRELTRLVPEKRVLIYGAGDAGEMIVRDMRNHDFYRYGPVGFIDDDHAKIGRRIHGVKVLGTRDALPQILARERVDAVVVAIPRATPATVRAIVQALEPFKVPIQTLPNLRDILDGKVTVNHIRTLAVEDLLERVPVRLDVEAVRHLIAGRRALVTGAGGSIGSELTRQVAVLGPAALVLVDRCENGLHALLTDARLPELRVRAHAVVCDVADSDRMSTVLATHRPEIIFHAAAHKHVPLMESNACEAVKNNIRGTRIVVEAARRFGVERFVLISTDKAVNPSSVMGVTKRIAELLVHGVNGLGAPICTTVRFGNVLASNGSVVPQFLAQIAAGGPVTVTHPDMRRYFMLIREAVHLVLQAAALAESGDLFVLEMGEQVRILDLARNLIRLSGFVPEDDIGIAFVGPRPGEKLAEELIGKDETADPTSSNGILRVQLSTPPEWSRLAQQIVELERLAELGDDDAVVARLSELVPTYRPWSPVE